jgi:endoglucanase
MKTAITFLLGLLLAVQLHSQSNLTVEILPVSDRILMLHFDEGEVDHPEGGEPFNSDVVTKTNLNTEAAGLTGTYSVQSSTDANYTSPQAPLTVNRKRKGTDYANQCDWNGWECNLDENDVVFDHWIYIKFDDAFQSGSSYTLSVADVGSGNLAINFTFDEFEMRSECIHVNLVGYVTAAEKKYAYLYHWMGDGGSMDYASYEGQPFYLVNTTTDEIAFTGQVHFRKAFDNAEFAYTNQSPNGNLIGADCYECDFSSFQVPGNYKIVIENLGCSFPFDIGCDVYRPIFHALIKGAYHQRSGIAKTSAYTDFVRPADHNPNVTPGFAGRLRYTSRRLCDYSSPEPSYDDTTLIVGGELGPINTWGWYHDAGDWDTYYSHTTVPAYLLTTFEMAGDRVSEDNINIPESGNGVPDILDEASWQLRYYYRTRHAIMDAGYGTGGVGGARTFGDLWGNDEATDTLKGSWQDTHRRWYVSGEDPFISYKYAGLAAQLAYNLTALGTTDPEGVNWLQEAEQSFDWASSNTLPGDETPKFDGELDLAKNRVYAAISLYRSTGNADYHALFVNEIDSIFTAPGFYWTNDIYQACWIYLNMPQGMAIDAVAFDLVRSKIHEDADFLINGFIDTRACRWGGNYWYNMLVGHQTTPIIVPSVAAHFFNSGDNSDGFLQNILTTADYFMGTNPLNMAWITGENLAERQPEYVFSLDNFALNEDKPYPGVIPYGSWYSQYFGPLGPWNLNWGSQYVYPNDATWPGHERWWNNRFSPLISEFTIHQNTATGVMVYGSLCGICQDPVGIEEIPTTDNTLKMYPNPANEEVNIYIQDNQFSADQIVITDLQGRTIESRSLRTGPRNFLSIDTSDYPEGVYLVNLASDEGNIISGKMVILR